MAGTSCVMSELPRFAKWRTSALRRLRTIQLALGMDRVNCRYFGARFEVSLREGLKRTIEQSGVEALIGGA